MTSEEIIADERYHTCGRCKWGDIPCDEYPCNECVHGFDNRKDFWEYSEDNAPHVIPQPKTGWWIIKFDDEKPITYVCSECDAVFVRKYNCCPNCGSHNGGEKDGSD